MSIQLAVTGSNLTGDVPFSAALMTDHGCEVLSSPPGERGDLARLCKTLCEHQGLGPEQIEHLVVDVGPGSYTGLRVAVTFVRILQAFGSIEVQAVDSLAVLAMHACQNEDGVRVRPLLDARRGRYHTACFDLKSGIMSEVEAPSATDTEQVLRSIAPDEIVVVPSALGEQLAEVLRDRASQVVIARELTASALLVAGLPLFTAAAKDLEPRYLMATYAED